jgi:hypothetical protein
MSPCADLPDSDDGVNEAYQHRNITQKAAIFCLNYGMVFYASIATQFLLLLADSIGQYVQWISI